MTIYDLKPRFQDLLRPLCRLLARIGVSANAVTVAAMVLSLATGLVLWPLGRIQLFLVLVPIVLLVRMALNAIDGMLAREHDQKTPLGAILNELGDVLADAEQRALLDALGGGRPPVSVFCFCCRFYLGFYYSLNFCFRFYFSTFF